jgi:murein L,D-transpeptidase YcbB/YkuD
MRWGWIAALPAAALGFGAAAQEPPVVPVPPPAAQQAPQAPVLTIAPPAAESIALTSAQAATALEVLRGADAHGLRPKDYLPAGVTDAAALSPEQNAALARGLIRYAHDVRVGRLALGDFPHMWAVRPPPYDATADLARAVAEDRLGPWLDGLDPPYAGYQALLRGLARYREIAAAGGWKAIPTGDTMSLGSTDPRVPALRARLAAEDPQVPAKGAATFDQALQDAVVRAQKRYGLKPDGAVGPGTLAFLNVPVEARIRQIVANLERWRWLPRTMPATRVQANAGAAIVTLFRDDRPVLSMKAVSGRPGDETPMLISEIHSVVINPPWNVPSSIATKELWPKAKRDPGYFARNDYVVIPTEGGGSRIQQKPGPKAALGRFKFDFDNPFTIYLHDTPSRGTFDLYARQASHGCVRLEKAQLLAEALLAGDPKWDKAAIEAQLADGKTLRVPLAEHVPVFVLYWTAFAGADGQMHFRADPYKWDTLLLERIGEPAAAV